MIDNFLSIDGFFIIIKRKNDEEWNSSAQSGGGYGRTGKEDSGTNKFCIITNSLLANNFWRKILLFYKKIHLLKGRIHIFIR